VGRIFQGYPPHDSMHFITFVKQQFRQIGAILPRNAGD
jgi:hypothetical protein